MLCTEWPCKFESNDWKNVMLPHYRKNHPWVKKPWEYFTSMARQQVKGHTL